MVEIDNDQLQLDTITQIQDKMISQNMRDSELLHNKEGFSTNNEINITSDTDNTSEINNIDEIGNIGEISEIKSPDSSKTENTFNDVQPLVELENDNKQLGGGDSDKTKDFQIFLLVKKVQIMMMDETHDYHQKEGTQFVIVLKN